MSGGCFFAAQVGHPDGACGGDYPRVGLLAQVQPSPPSYPNRCVPCKVVTLAHLLPSLPHPHHQAPSWADTNQLRDTGGTRLREALSSACLQWCPLGYSDSFSLEVVLKWCPLGVSGASGAPWVGVVPVWVGLDPAVGAVLAPLQPSWHLTPAPLKLSWHPSQLGRTSPQLCESAGKLQSSRRVRCSGASRNQLQSPRRVLLTGFCLCTQHADGTKEHAFMAGQTAHRHTPTWPGTRLQHTRQTAYRHTPTWPGSRLHGPNGQMILCRRRVWTPEPAVEGGMWSVDSGACSPEHWPVECACRPRAL